MYYSDFLLEIPLVSLAPILLNSFFPFLGTIPGDLVREQTVPFRAGILGQDLRPIHPLFQKVY